MCISVGAPRNPEFQWKSLKSVFSTGTKGSANIFAHPSFKYSEFQNWGLGVYDMSLVLKIRKKLAKEYEIIRSIIINDAFVFIVKDKERMHYMIKVFKGLKEIKTIHMDQEMIDKYVVRNEPIDTLRILG